MKAMPYAIASLVIGIPCQAFAAHGMVMESAFCLGAQLTCFVHVCVYAVKAWKQAK